MASQGTVKLVADIAPSLKNALDRIARARKITRRAAIEQAITSYIDAAADEANGQGKGAKQG
jgi:predicted transcriptional regulator